MKRWIAALPAVLLLLCAGCTPKTIETAPPTPAVLIPNDPAVKTDWSKLTPYEPENSVYTRRYEEFTDTLIPAGDYGPLLPYLGDMVGRLYGDGYSGGIYGLMTLEGEIVTDPVFTQVWRGGSSGGYHDNAPLPYLMLTKGTSSSSPNEWPEPAQWAMAAPDGSWCTEFKYMLDGEMLTWGQGSTYSATEDGIFALDGTTLVYLDGATGEERIRIEDIPAAEDGSTYPFYEALFSAFWREGKAYYQEYEGPYYAVDAATMERTALTDEAAAAIRGERGGYMDPDHPAWGNFEFEDKGNGLRTVFAPDGALLGTNLPSEHLTWGYNLVTGGRYLAVSDGEKWSFYNEYGGLMVSAALPEKPYGGPAAVPAGTGGQLLITTEAYCGLRAFDGQWKFYYPLALGGQD